MNRDQLCTQNALGTAYKNIEVIIRSLERNIAGCPLSKKEDYYEVLTHLIKADEKLRYIEDYIISLN